MITALVLWVYAAAVAVTALPSITQRGPFWEVSLAIVVVTCVPTAALGALVLVPRIARGVALVATLWMGFLAWSWIGNVAWLAVASAVVGVVTLIRALPARWRPGAGDLAAR